MLFLCDSVELLQLLCKACVTQEGVTLRWAPMDMQTFQKGIDNGYVVERYAIVKDDEVLSVEEISK